MVLTILIINYNEKVITKNCLQSIDSQSIKSFSVLLLDNGSKKEEQVHDNRVTQIFLNKNYGFPFAVNLGVKACKTDWILILNNDCEIAPNFLEEMQKAINNNPSAKVLSPKIYRKTVNYSKNILYACGDTIDEKGLAKNIGRGETDNGQYDNQKNVPLATFACLLVKKEILKRFPLDESYFGYYEDVDFGLRLQKAKIPIYFVPNAICYHIGEASFAKLNKIDNEIRQFKNLSLTMIKHFSFYNIVRHYALFNLKSFRYYFFMKKKWNFIFVELQILFKLINRSIKKFLRIPKDIGQYF